MRQVAPPWPVSAKERVAATAREGSPLPCSSQRPSDQEKRSRTRNDGRIFSPKLALCPATDVIMREIAARRGRDESANLGTAVAGVTGAARPCCPAKDPASAGMRPPSISICTHVRSAGSVSSHGEPVAPSKRPSVCHGKARGTTRSCRQMASAFLLSWRIKPRTYPTKCLH